MSESLEEIMARAGYVPAAKAAEAIGVSQVASVHKMVTRGHLRASRVGRYWFVSVKSMLEAYKDAEPILERIRGLGVAPKDDESTTRISTKKGGSRGSRATNR